MKTYVFSGGVRYAHFMMKPLLRWVTKGDETRLAECEEALDADIPPLWRDTLQASPDHSTLLSRFTYAYATDLVDHVILSVPAAKTDALRQSKTCLHELSTGESQVSLSTMRGIACSQHAQTIICIITVAIMPSINLRKWTKKTASIEMQYTGHVNQGRLQNTLVVVGARLIIVCSSIASSTELNRMPFPLLRRLLKYPHIKFTVDPFKTH
ncbi:hypothetical protein FRC03_007983 [Tulasnella sp. 419]|nr:hypothetical protein FRC03_007983 [Tulasnella sp. 419]